MQKKYLSYFIQPLITVVLLLLGLLVYGKLVGPVTFSSSQDAVNKRTFTVQGEGKVTAKPDQFTTDFTIHETGTTQDEVKNQGNDKQRQAVEALKKIGFTDNDIKTTNYSINPNYTYGIGALQPNGGSRQSGYVLDITTEVSAKSADKINKAIDALTPIGVNVNGLQTSVGDLTPFQDQARTDAIKQAKAKAASMAQAAGFKLGSIASIQEGSPVQPGPVLFQGKAEALPSTSVPTQINPGTQEVTANVSITYYIN